MKSIIFTLTMLLTLGLPAVSGAIGVELAVGGWYHEPNGTISYKGLTSNDYLDLERDLKYDADVRFMGRLKVDAPFPMPNIYLMATRMRFDGVGRKDVDFKFGDQTFNTDVDFTSKVVLDHYDIALYYGIPGIREASLGKVNLELGIDARVVDIEAEVSQSGIRETGSFVLPVPMLYAGVQITPMNWLAFEAEFRGISIDSDHIWSVIGRVKFRPIKHAFFAAGWRHEDVDIDEDDVKADVQVTGPFAEVGLEL